MSAAELTGLWANIPKLEAQDELRARRAKSDLTADSLFDLVLQATGDRDRAERAFMDFRHSELRAGVMPAT